MNQRKRQVLDSALQLFIEKGFHETSIQDILDKALISKGTFYNYFSSKVECFKSIMEQTRYEASLLRHEMLLNQDITDENLLLEQILVLMQINKKQNLVSLFENIFQSNDKELRHLLERYRLLEIEWVSNRFTDIFGEEVRPYSLELAILYFAMVHHLTYSHRLFYSEMIDQKKILQIALRNVKAIYPIMLENGDILITQDALQLVEEKKIYQSITKNYLIKKVQGFLDQLKLDTDNEVGAQFTESILDELQRNELRLAVIEAMLKPFREAFVNTPHAGENVELANLLWYFIKNGDQK
ncbi:AcrR family transcriptional regulator [Solibacillus kalamii]|uniref:TetR family transcriptional regulator n=1 Tax=Solibacillus kalamii TaxID=1748298 RepID=A0ABX3ZIW2_9BACL|nr:TetR/AcrR family transcriptional regulator [Solibacillus kalamii]MBM7664575.1 AcrR family transcriptional regulator [Solibacillus kalamii]OUZ39677.1 TetR family transcriptional regulator [Solibacillus kalamii]